MTRRLLAALTAALLLLTGCRFDGPASLPLPAGPAAGADPIRVTVIFDDAGNLARKGTCRSNDVPIGTIESITLDTRLRARVVCLVNRTVDLPANTVGRLSESSLLGERFVALGAPAGEEPTGNLRDGAVLAATGNIGDPNIEQVLSALSALLNGGSLEQIQTINRELNTALSPRAPTARALIGQLTTLTGGLNAHRKDITTALDGLDRLSGTLAKQRQKIGAAIDSIPDGLEVLHRQRPQLVKLLQRLSKLAKVATPLIRRTRADTVADFRALRPILANLADSGDNLTESLKILTTYPFPSKALDAMQGDYFRLNATINLDLDTINVLLGELTNDDPALPEPPGGPSADLPGPPQLPELPRIGPLTREPAVDLGDLLNGGS